MYIYVTKLFQGSVHTMWCASIQLNGLWHLWYCPIQWSFKIMRLIQSIYDTAARIHWIYYDSDTTFHMGNRTLTQPIKNSHSHVVRTYISPKNIIWVQCILCNFPPDTWNFENVSEIEIENRKLIGLVIERQRKNCPQIISNPNIHLKQYYGSRKNLFHDQHLYARTLVLTRTNSWSPQIADGCSYNWIFNGIN